MALVIERWSNGKVVGGLEEWWDDIDYLLSRSERRYRVLDHVDPYGDLSVDGSDLAELAKECRELAATGKSHARVLLEKLAELSDEAYADPTGKLEFVGD